jgi:hypothetical protein
MVLLNKKELAIRVQNLWNHVESLMKDRATLIIVLIFMKVAITIDEVHTRAHIPRAKHSVRKYVQHVCGTSHLLSMSMVHHILEKFQRKNNTTNVLSKTCDIINVTCRHIVCM